jgi:hypothetical protein
LRDWIEHDDQPAQHELGWADYQMRPERASVRHWQVVLLAFTFSLLVGGLPRPAPTATSLAASAEPAGGEKITTRRRVRAWLCPWARRQVSWRRWSRTAPPPHRPTAPPPEVAALLAHVAHVAHARPLEPPT